MVHFGPSLRVFGDLARKPIPLRVWPKYRSPKRAHFVPKPGAVGGVPRSVELPVICSGTTEALAELQVKLKHVNEPLTDEASPLHLLVQEAAPRRDAGSRAEGGARRIESTSAPPYSPWVHRPFWWGLLSAFYAGLRKRPALGSWAALGLVHLSASPLRRMGRGGYPFRPVDCRLLALSCKMQGTFF
jgi:hypothetical protein